MSQKDFVVIVFELDLECQGVVEATSFLLKLILKVANILPISVPTIAGATVLTVLLFLRIEKWFHALVV